jgi:uncharacterized protein YbjT (DUF2867 family)
MDPCNSSMEIAVRVRCPDDMPTILILGGTGKTGRRIVSRLSATGASVRSAARRGADVRFDWDDSTTWDPVLRGVDVVYLVPPTLRTDYAQVVIAFVTRAQAAGVRHVTYLSARGVDQAPAEIPPRAVELDLASRDGLTHTYIRPGWFMQDFSEAYFHPSIAAEGVIVAPAGDGAEPFVHVDDIADVAVATLLEPEAHAGAGYTLSGPEALTFAQAAQRISAAAGRSIAYVDVPRDEWVARAVADGIPEDYAELLAMLIDERLRVGAGAEVTDDVERVTGHPPRSFDDYVREREALAAWVRDAA